MKKRDVIYALLVIMVLLVATVVVSAFGTYNFMTKHFENKDLDMYKIQEYSLENSKALFECLENGGDGIDELLIDSEGAEELLERADWENADWDNKRSFGGGNFSTEATADGKMEYADTWWVPIDGEKYMIYIQTVSSRYGRENDGIQFIAVTTWAHYDAIDWSWEPETDEETVRVGTPFERGDDDETNEEE